MMPPYTSLWLQILLDSKGTAAWLRTGEPSPVSERGQYLQRGPAGNSGHPRDGATPHTLVAEEATPGGGQHVVRGKLPDEQAGQLCCFTSGPRTPLKWPTQEEVGRQKPSGTPRDPPRATRSTHTGLFGPQNNPGYRRETEAHEGHGLRGPRKLGVVSREVSSQRRLGHLPRQKGPEMGTRSWAVWWVLNGTTGVRADVRVGRRSDGGGERGTLPGLL